MFSCSIQKRTLILQIEESINDSMSSDEQLAKVGEIVTANTSYNLNDVLVSADRLVFLILGVFCET